ncbi:DUF1829 domain-containing protein [Alicyclobacillaceae bacterium I2511]|nr:DUF1829 domain-containing protein [Alicyclobacillaceae bacterium I2511]
MDIQADLQQMYLDWLKERVKYRDIHDAIEITTPLLDHHNDFMQIYVTKHGSSLRLSDAGYIMNDLDMSGIDIDSSLRRKEILQVILNRYGVSISANDELFVDTSVEMFPQRKHMLLQAMMAVNDMFMTSRTNVSSIFLEEVENFFIKNEVVYVQNINFTGRSGLTHSFDFVLPKMKSKPERVVQTFNNPTRQNAEVLLFAWNDTRGTRQADTQLYAILNDADRKVSPDVLSALGQYEVKDILWTKREKHLMDLIA